MAEIKPTYPILVSGDVNSNKYYNCFPEGSEFRVEYGRVDSTKTIKRYLMSK